MHYKEICDLLKLSTKTYYNKYSGVTDYKLSEVIALMLYYNMSLTDLLPVIKEDGKQLAQKIQIKGESVWKQQN